MKKVVCLMTAALLALNACGGGGGRISLDWLEDYTAFSVRIEPEIDIDKAELVFAGYGIVAPEYGKNDFEGIENPAGKVAIMIVNEPGLGGEDETYFNGDIMTYYGRWTYKFEEGARQGLKGVLIIHEDRGAGYPWSVVWAPPNRRCTWMTIMEPIIAR